jgi:hypothetical protein
MEVDSGAPRRVGFEEVRARERKCNRRPAMAMTLKSNVRIIIWGRVRKDSRKSTAKRGYYDSL